MSATIRTRTASIIRYTCGVTIYTGGRNDRSEVRDRNGEVTYTGRYRQCVAYVRERGLRCVS